LGHKTEIRLKPNKILYEGGREMEKKIKVKGAEIEITEDSISIKSKKGYFVSVPESKRVRRACKIEIRGRPYIDIETVLKFEYSGGWRRIEGFERRGFSFFLKEYVGITHSEYAKEKAKAREKTRVP
jgi:hypothetical protein